jgi:arabinofuranan 3-O-arabinosyltransferase
VWRGGVSVWATSYGNAITYTPEDRPAGALDDDPETAWYTGAFADATGERIEVSYDSERTTDRVRLVQAARGVQNRWITGVRLRFDGGAPIDVDLGSESRQVQGQWIDVGPQTFSEMSIEVRATDVGSRDSYADVSAVGFSDIRLGSDDLRLQESIRPPTDVLDALGPASDDLPLALSFTRLRARATAALRSDPEQAMARDIDLPTARSFSLGGTARLSDIATDEMLDQLLGLPSAADGGVDTDASRHLPGDLSGRPTNAVDDDPSTHWSPGFLGQDAEWASYTQEEPVTFDRMDLQVVADGRHTVPTRLRIVADGVTAATVDIPAIEDRAEKDAVVSVPLSLDTPVTGRRIEIHIDASRPVETNDWISSAPVIMPVGIAEWGIEGISEDIPTGAFDSGCRDDLVTVDGSPVSVEVTGTIDAAVTGQALDIALCGPSAAGVDLPEGASQLRTARGRDTGLQIDTVTLRSDAGGSASSSDGPLITGDDPVDVTVTRSDRWRRTVEVGPRSEDTWLVVGQSHNEGWQASIDGSDLGEPVLVDGYSAAFLIPAGTDPVTVEVEWAPQKVVLGGFGISILAVLACLILALRPWRWRRGAVSSVPLADLPAAVEAPQPLSLAPLLRSSGTAPGWPASIGLALVSGVVGFLAVNLVASAVLAVLALVVVRFARARPLLVVLPSALLALSGAYIVLQQVRHRLPAGFEWPSRFGRVHGVAYVAVLLLGLGVLVDRLRTGSWTDDPALSGTTPQRGTSGQSSGLPEPESGGAATQGETTRTGDGGG